MSGFELVQGSSENEVMLSFRHPTDPTQSHRRGAKTEVLLQAMKALEAAEARYTKLAPGIALTGLDRERVYDQLIKGWEEGNFASKFAMPVGMSSGTAAVPKLKIQVIRMAERVRKIRSTWPEDTAHQKVKFKGSPRGEFFLIYTEK
eukprot:g3383.t1